MTISNIDFKKINSVLYKFIWNRHYLAAKAPERIKREIMNKPIKMGGLGMLDIAELDKSLKLRALGRLTVSNHPFLRLIRDKIDFNDYIDPKLSISIERVANEGINLLKLDRIKQVKNSNGNVKTLSLLRESRLKNLISTAGKRSLQYFNLIVSNKLKVKDLSQRELNSITRFMVDKDLVQILQEAIALRVTTDPPIGTKPLYQGRKGIIDLSTITSKIFRTLRHEPEPECIFKLGIILEPKDSLNWLAIVDKLTSTKHKDTLLRLAHGEIYSKERKYRFGLVDNPNCDRCGTVETIQHKLIECPSIEIIWNLVIRLTNKVLPVTPNCDLLHRALGAFRHCTKEVLTIQAEALTRILYIKSTDQTPPPSAFVRSILRTLEKNDKNGELKDCIEVLLLECT